MQCRNGHRTLLLHHGNAKTMPKRRFYVTLTLLLRRVRPLGYDVKGPCMGAEA